MADELDRATEILNAALVRYNTICTHLRAQYMPRTGFQRDNTPELTARVSQEVSTIASHESEILNCKALLSQLRNLSKSQNGPASFSSLPPEVLTRIFEDVIHIRPCPALEYRLFTPSDAKFLKDPVILSHVCSYWRRIILNTAHLWSHIDIDPIQADNPKASARLETYMTRSADAVLDIHISEISRFSYPHRSICLGDQPSITNLLTIAAPRIRSLNLNVSRSKKQVYHSFLATCFSGCTPGVLEDVSIRPAGSNSDHPRTLLVEPHNLQPEEDAFTGLPSEIVEAAWYPVKALRLKEFRPKWTSKAYLGLTELRLLRVLELDLELQRYTPGDKSITPVRLDHLETLILGGSKEKQLGSILQLIAPGSLPMSLSLVDPYIGSVEFTSKDEFARFVARSNVSRICMHEFADCTRLLEILRLVPTAKVVAIGSLQNGDSDEGSTPSDLTIDTLYVLSSCSRCNRFAWSQLEAFVRRHHVQRLILWRYDFRYCALAELGIEAIPDNLYTLCPVVKLVPDTDPNPILDWFGD